MQTCSVECSHCQPTKTFLAPAHGIKNMEDQRPTDQTVKTVPQNEVVLNALQDEYIQNLLNKGIETSGTSIVRPTKDGGLVVETLGDQDKSKSTMVVKGEADYEAPFHGFHKDHQWDGDFTITRSQGGQTVSEQASFKYRGYITDDLWQRYDRSNLTFERRDANGNPFQSYLAAESNPVVKNRQYVLDPNGQNLRQAKPIGDSVNCGFGLAMDSSSRAFDCNFLIRDPRLNTDISANRTTDNWAQNKGYRTVLRTPDGVVKGIVEQRYTLDENGNLASVHTRARRPADLKK